MEVEAINAIFDGIASVMVLGFAMLYFYWLLKY